MWEVVVELCEDYDVVWGLEDLMDVVVGCW